MSFSPRTFVASALLGLVAFSSGCVGAMRSPDMYRDDTGKLLATRGPAMKACYDEVLKTTPDAAGVVAITFTIEPESGVVKDAAVDTAKTTAPEPVRACVLKSLDELSLYPGDKKQGKGAWAFEFQPGGGAPAATPAPAAGAAEKS